MTYKKNKEQQITADDIQIDSSNLLEKKDVYLNQKYTQDLQHLTICINSFDWHTQTYICQLCSHENCQKFMGMIEAKEDDDHKVYLSYKFAWVLENEDGSALKAGDCIATSNIKGLMKVSKEAKTNLRIGLDVEEQDNILLQQITGHDRLGLLYQPILNEEGNPVFERLPKVRFFNLDGTSSEEFKYFQSIKKATVIKDIKTKKLDLDAVEKIKKQDDEKIARLTRNTKSVSYSRPSHSILARKESVSSFLVRRSSRDVLTPRSSMSSTKVKEEAEPIKRTVVKAYLVPIFE